MSMNTETVSQYWSRLGEKCFETRGRYTTEGVLRIASLPDTALEGRREDSAYHFEWYPHSLWCDESPNTADVGTHEAYQNWSRWFYVPSFPNMTIPQNWTAWSCVTLPRIEPGDTLLTDTGEQLVIRGVTDSSKNS